MGQIVAKNAKPKRANLRAVQTTTQNGSLSQNGSLASTVLDAGEYILICSANDMGSDGSGVFDSYIVGDGTSTCSQLLPATKIVAVDGTVVQGSTNAVSGGAVYTAIQTIDVSSQISGKADKSEMSVVAGTGANADKTTITLKQGTSATVLTSHQDISGKQNILTFDSAPTDNSTNPVTSGGVKTALDAKANSSTTYTKTEVNNLIIPAGFEAEWVTSLPLSGTTNTIYCVQGSTSFSAYGWDGTQFVKMAEYDWLVDDELSMLSSNPIQNKGVFNSLHDCTNVFTNSSEVTWTTGNINSSGAIVSNYANKYVLVDLPSGASTFRIDTDITDFDLSIYTYSSKWGSIQKITSGKKTTYLTTTASQLLLMLYDKPSDAQAKAAGISISTVKEKYVANDNLVLTNSDLSWASGNIANQVINFSYANRFAAFSFGRPVTGFDILIDDISSSYNVVLYHVDPSNGNIDSDGLLSVGEVNKISYTEAYSVFYLLVYDKPASSVTDGMSVTITYYSSPVPYNNVSTDYADSNSSHVPSMSIFNPFVQELYSERLTSGNGITWIQGGINGTTGIWESNAKAICSLPIYFNGDDSAVVYQGDITNFNKFIAIYDENGAYVGSSTTEEIDPDGSIRFVYYGSGYITPTDGDSSGCYVDRRLMLNNRVKSIEAYISNETSYANPVLRADFPDPTIWNGEDGYYYALATGEISGRTLCRSANLVDWEDTLDLPYTASVAEEIASAFNNSYTSYWAPCVVKIKPNQWNMYLAKPYGGIAILKSSHPTIGYEFVRMTTASFSDYIDADVIRDEQNRVWMFAGSSGMMHRRLMTDDGLDFAEGSSWVHVAGRPSNESGNTDRVKTFEGEYLYRRKGYWYLFCSSGKYANNTYAIRVVRSSTIDGNFVDKEGNLATDGYAETIMTSSGDLYGPGHNSQIIPDRNGKTWMLYHSHWSGASSSSDRPMCLDEVLWDENGWPYFATGHPSVSSNRPNM